MFNLLVAGNPAGCPVVVDENVPPKFGIGSSALTDLDGFEYAKA